MVQIIRWIKFKWDLGRQTPNNDTDYFSPLLTSKPSREDPQAGGLWQKQIVQIQLSARQHPVVPPRREVGRYYSATMWKRIRICMSGLRAGKQNLGSVSWQRRLRFGLEHVEQALQSGRRQKRGAAATTTRIEEMQILWNGIEDGCLITEWIMRCFTQRIKHSEWKPLEHCRHGTTELYIRMGAVKQAFRTQRSSVCGLRSLLSEISSVWGLKNLVCLRTQRKSLSVDSDIFCLRRSYHPNKST